MSSVTRRGRPQGSAAEPSALKKIIEAFERLLAQGESFTTISVEQLTREAGLVRATFYLHFRNKGQLVSHAMKGVEDEVKEAAIAHLKKGGSYGRAEFQAFMRDVMNILFRHRHAIWAMNEVAVYDADVQAVFADFMNKRTAEIQLTIDKLKAANLANPEVGPGLASMLAWTIERCFSKQLNETSSPQKRLALADQLTHVVWSAVAAPGVH